MLNAPSGKVVLAILATRWRDVADLGRMLKWLRRRWSECVVTVVGDEGGGEEELAARRGGALFLTRPVELWHWSALLSHVMRRERPEPTPQADAGAGIVTHPRKTDK